MGDWDYVSKRKQDRIPANERRTKAVKVMFNEDEFTAVESVASRHNISKAEVIRAMVFSHKLDPVKEVPEVNVELARNLGRALEDLATVAGGMRVGKLVALEEVQHQVWALQRALRGDDG